MTRGLGVSQETVDRWEAKGLITCHPHGRAFPSAILREMLRAMGIVTCPNCYRVVAILGPKGKQWRPQR